MNGIRSVRSDLDRVQRTAIAVAAVAALTVLVFAFRDPLQFYRSYLFAYLYWFGLSLGSLAVVMLHHTTGGSWGFAIRRLLEAGTRTLPLMALLFVPFLLAAERVWPWAAADAAHHDALLAHKAPYLNLPFFIARAALYFALWIGFGWVLLRLTARQDRTGDPGPGRRARTLAGPGLAVYGLTMTFAAIDWGMSLEPHWFSTMYGVIFIVGQVLSTFAFAIVAAGWLKARPPFSRFLSAGHFHDLGNLLFAFVLLWAYVNFSQYLIIWSGNVSEETPWYLHRSGGGWQNIAIALIVFHLLVPFFLLLSRKIKRGARMLGVVAILLMLTRLADLYWLIGPAFHREGFAVHALDFATPIALGGLWIAWFIQKLKGRPLISLQDARLQGMLEQPAVVKKKRLEDEPADSPDVRIQSEGSHPGTPAAPYERSDARVAAIFKFALGMFVGLGVVGGLTAAFLSTIETRLERDDRPLHPLAAEREVPPEPRLQTLWSVDAKLDPEVDVDVDALAPAAAFSRQGWAEHRHESERRLSSYGWIDRPTGTVHIPIERAIELTLEQGLPSAKPADPKPPR